MIISRNYEHIYATPEVILLAFLFLFACFFFFRVDAAVILCEKARARPTRGASLRSEKKVKARKPKDGREEPKKEPPKRAQPAQASQLPAEGATSAEGSAVKATAGPASEPFASHNFSRKSIAITSSFFPHFLRLHACRSATMFPT